MRLEAALAKSGTFFCNTYCKRIPHYTYITYKQSTLFDALFVQSSHTTLHALTWLKSDHDGCITQETKLHWI